MAERGGGAGRIFALVMACALALFGQSLQSVIDGAPAGSKIELPAGRFAGPIRIDKPLILSGAGEETLLEGNGSGTVVTIAASHVTLEGLTIRRSGDQRYRLDAGIRIDGGSDVTVRDCNLSDVLFGIVVFDARDLHFEGNGFASFHEKIVDNRGDAIRLWNCRDALIRDNTMIGIRDLSVNRSRNVRIENNRVEGCRYGVLSNLSSRIKILGNTLEDAYAGVYAKGTMDLLVEGNDIAKSRTATGTGVLLAKGKALRIRRNRIVRHAQAFYIDSSPVEKGMQRAIEENRIALNHTAFHFHAALKNNTIRRNTVTANLDDVVMDIRGARRGGNMIEGNYWDRYEGFDRDGDGIGDTPYVVRIYADKLWQFDRRLKFFYGSAVFAIIDFIERLAPFSAPVELLRDEKPRMRPYRFSSGTGLPK